MAAARRNRREIVEDTDVLIAAAGYSGADMEPTILAATARWAAVNKPSGIVVHRTRGASEQPLLQRVRDQLGRHVFAVQRLDRATSGVMLFALDPEAASVLSTAFAQRTIEKRYRALVRGFVADTGVVDAPLRDDRGVSREALTRFECLARVELPIATGRYATTRWSWIELTPETGRMHQLRRHLAHVRHPILGDVDHGDGAHNRGLREHFGVRRLVLCATELRFTDPFSGAETVIDGPLAPEIIELLARLGVGDGPGTIR